MSECITGRPAGLHTLGELPRHGCSGSTVVGYAEIAAGQVWAVETGGQEERGGRQEDRTGVGEVGGRDGGGRRKDRRYRGSGESGDGLLRCPRRPVSVHF